MDDTTPNQRKDSDVDKSDESNEIVVAENSSLISATSEIGPKHDFKFLTGSTFKQNTAILQKQLVEIFLTSREDRRILINVGMELLFINVLNEQPIHSFLNQLDRLYKLAVEREEILVKEREETCDMKIRDREFQRIRYSTRQQINVIAFHMLEFLRAYFKTEPDTPMEYPFYFSKEDFSAIEDIVQCISKRDLLELDLYRSSIPPNVRQVCSREDIVRMVDDNNLDAAVAEIERIVQKPLPNKKRVAILDAFLEYRNKGDTEVQMRTEENQLKNQVVGLICSTSSPVESQEQNQVAGLICSFSDENLHQSQVAGAFSSSRSETSQQDEKSAEVMIGKGDIDQQQLRGKVCFPPKLIDQDETQKTDVITPSPDIQLQPREVRQVFPSPILLQQNPIIGQDTILQKRKGLTVLYRSPTGTSETQKVARASMAGPPNILAERIHELLKHPPTRVSLREGLEILRTVLPKNDINGMVSSVAVPIQLFEANGPDGVVDVTGVKVFQAPNAEDVPLSAVLTISIHAIRLFYLSLSSANAISFEHRMLLGLVMNEGRERVRWDLKYARSILQSTTATTFKSAIAVVSSFFVNQQCPCPFDTISLSSFSKKTLVHEFKNSYKQTQTSGKSLCFVVFTNEYPLLNVSNLTVPYLFHVDKKLCNDNSTVHFQTCGAVYLSPGTNIHKVFIITYSRCGFSGLYHVWEYSPGPDVTLIQNPFFEVPHKIEGYQQNSIGGPLKVCVEDYILVGLLLFETGTQSSSLYEALSPNLIRWSDRNAIDIAAPQILRLEGKLNGGWLDDNLIDEILSLAGLYSLKFPNGKRNKVVSTKFYQMLTNKDMKAKRFSSLRNINYEKARRFIDRDGFDISKPESVVHIPINVGEYHWIYAIVLSSMKIIYILDSMNSSNKDVQSYLLTFIEAHFLHHHNVGPEGWTCKTLLSAQQPDGRNCGIFTILNTIRGIQAVLNENVIGRFQDDSTWMHRRIAPNELENVRSLIVKILYGLETIKSLFDLIQSLDV